MSDSLHSLSSTWTIFCVGCNERYPLSSPQPVCPNCGLEATYDSTGHDTVLVHEDEHQHREIVHRIDDADPLVGRTLHVYQCVSLIGSGGMGRVYLAMHNDLQRHCALKILRPKRAACDEEFVERFLQEGRAAAALVHPNVVTIHAVGEFKGKHFIEMEFIPGRSLQQLINDEGALTVSRALSLAVSTAQGLAAAHREGIIHRDVKPDNIMLNRRGIPKVSDFGLAKRVLNHHGQPLADGICGTPNYMAPELFQGQVATASSDVYALGVCLFVMLTGRLPHRARSIAELKYIVEQEDVPNIRDLRGDVSLEVAEAVAMMTSSTPANRPRDADAASQLLAAVLGHERDLETLLIEAFANEPGVTWKREDSRYTLTRTLPNERSQRVFMEPSEHRVDERLLLFYSVCGPADPNYFEQALKLNSEMLHGSLAIREIDGRQHFVVVNTYPRATVDPEEIHATVLEVAQRADDIEHLLTGLDQH